MMSVPRVFLQIIFILLAVFYTSCVRNGTISLHQRHKKKQVLLIAGFFNLSKKRLDNSMMQDTMWREPGFGGEGIVPAVKFAVHHINGNPSILPGFKLKVKFLNSQVSYWTEWKLIWHGWVKVNMRCDVRSYVSECLHLCKHECSITVFLKEQTSCTEPCFFFVFVFIYFFLNISVISKSTGCKYYKYPFLYLRYSDLRHPPPPSLTPFPISAHYFPSEAWIISSLWCMPPKPWFNTSQSSWHAVNLAYRAQ